MNVRKSKKGSRLGGNPRAATRACMLACPVEASGRDNAAAETNQWNQDQTDANGREQ